MSLYGYESAVTSAEWQSPGVELTVLDPVPAFSSSYDPINWRYPVWGAVIGGAAGAVWGTVAMMNSDVEWIAPPAHYFTLVSVSEVFSVCCSIQPVRIRTEADRTSGERGAKRTAGAVGDQPVSLLIHAGPHGPTDRQRDWFAQLKDKLPEYRTAIESSVDGATGSEWSLVVVDFQTEEPAPARIELTFEHDSTGEMVALGLDVDLQVVEVNTAPASRDAHI